MHILVAICLSGRGLVLVAMDITTGLAATLIALRTVGVQIAAVGIALRAIVIQGLAILTALGLGLVQRVAVGLNGGAIILQIGAICGDGSSVSAFLIGTQLSQILPVFRLGGP